MSDSNVSRRGFHKLTMAAAGGLMAGAASVSVQAADKKPKLSVDPSLLISAPNGCRGLNTCKGEGKGSHSCAGQSSCAEVAKHSCAGENDCKGQGGCGGYPAQNTCKGKGHCAVPLSKETWKLARKQFEQLMKDVGKKVGPVRK